MFVDKAPLRVGQTLRALVVVPSTGGHALLTVENEFPNNLYQRPVLSRHGVQFRVVSWQDLQSSITERTRVVVLSALNYGTGFRAPIEALGPALKARGILAASRDRLWPAAGLER